MLKNGGRICVFTFVISDCVTVVELSLRQPALNLTNKSPKGLQFFQIFTSCSGTYKG